MIRSSVGSSIFFASDMMVKARTCFVKTRSNS